MAGGEVGSVQLVVSWFTNRLWALVCSALCGSVKTSLYAILFPPNWAQEPCELKCEMETQDTYVPTRFHLIQTPVLANFIALRPNRVLSTEMPSQTALCKNLLACRVDVMQEWPYRGVQPVDQVLRKIA